LHRQEEKIIEESGILYTFLHAGAFMQNFVNFFGQTIRTQSTFYIPAGDGKVSFVDARDIAAVATQILLAKNNGTKINDQYENKKYGITGNKALSYSQVTEILSNALGRRITYVNITEEDARKAMKKMGMEDWLIDALIEFYNVIKSGDASQSTAVVEQITGRKPIYHLNNLSEITLVRLIDCMVVRLISKLRFSTCTTISNIYLVLVYN
jgi:uncharacterized protein YbjT (DUF2867 family)